MNDKFAVGGDPRVTEDVAILLSPATVRQRAHELLALCRRGETKHFRIQDSAMEDVTVTVIEVTRHNYPDLSVPLHARLRHFEMGGVDRLKGFEPSGPNASAAKEELARRLIDLVMVSVLVDAGAGPTWTFRDDAGTPWQRSEGLALASLAMFRAGLFSNDPARNPLRVDAQKLCDLRDKDLAEAFQVTPDNPMEGLAGRMQLLRSLGQALLDKRSVFGTATPRPGGLVDCFKDVAQDRRLPAALVLKTLLLSLGSIWPGRHVLDGINLGDTWKHSAIQGAGRTKGLMPFHKLSQWLTYSLVEPLTTAGFHVTDLDELTGLPEYRNGGLFLDGGVLIAREPSVLEHPIGPATEWMVEWRALTVALLDEIAAKVRQKLGKDSKSLPLGSVLQGGTWSAGRLLAARRRPGGAPPVTLVSDGTVF